MGFFDIFKSKQSKLEDTIQKMLNSYFPKGKKDIDAGTDEVLYILKNSVPRGEAQQIFIKSVSLSKISETFDKARLKSHLAGYCLQHFNQQQIDRLFDYIVAINAAMMIHHRTPSEIRREAEGYSW